MRFGFRKDRLFKKEHSALLRKAAHQVLRPLEHKFPSKMGEAKQIRFVSERSWWGVHKDSLVRDSDLAGSLVATVAATPRCGSASNSSLAFIMALASGW